MDVGASVGERANVQTRGGNRVSTISLVGCSTSVALTTGPTDDDDEEEEEEKEEVLIIRRVNCINTTSGICH